MMARAREGRLGLLAGICLILGACLLEVPDLRVASEGGGGAGTTSSTNTTNTGGTGGAGGGREPHARNGTDLGKQVPRENRLRDPVVL